MSFASATFTNHQNFFIRQQFHFFLFWLLLVCVFFFRFKIQNAKLLMSCCHVWLSLFFIFSYSWSSQVAEAPFGSKFWILEAWTFINWWSTIYLIYFYLFNNIFHFCTKYWKCQQKNKDAESVNKDIESAHRISISFISNELSLYHTFFKNITSTL